LIPCPLALADRIPCLAPDPCPHVPAQSRVTVPFEEAIVGYRFDTQRATVYWWHFVQQPDGSLSSDLDGAHLGWLSRRPRAALPREMLVWRLTDAHQLRRLLSVRTSLRSSNPKRRRQHAPC
jgi:hypothetical protein